MILSNVEISNALVSEDSGIKIGELEQNEDASAKPFNTTAVDLRLDKTIFVPNEQSGVHYRLDTPYDKEYVGKNGDSYELSDEQPYILAPNKLILGQTFEKVEFRIPPDPEKKCYAARVEWKSSHARHGILIHFTAPTIHCGFKGPITLEIINLGATSIALTPMIYICQLIIEEVSGIPATVPNQFSGQTKPVG